MLDEGKHFIHIAEFSAIAGIDTLNDKQIAAAFEQITKEFNLECEQK